MLKIAHRGASSQKPENTIEAFAKALEMGADAIELDVHFCKTGEIVVIHDETLERTTRGHGKVADKSLPALQELGVPSLQETLDLINDRAVMFIETKVPNIAKPLGRLIENVVRSGKWHQENLIVCSFDIQGLREIKKLYPKIPVAPAFDKIESLDAIADIPPFAVNLRIDNVDKKLVEKIHARGWKIFVWTVNDPEEIRHAKTLNPDGIISDYLERL